MTRSRGWEFTWNNYTNEDIDYINNLNFDYLIYGKEIGHKENTPHLQGFIYFENDKTFNRMRKMMKNNHIEKARSFDALIAYSSKDGDVYEAGIRPKQGKKHVEEEIEIIDPNYQWEQDILNIIKEKPCKRTIYWYWDEDGDVGKSCFTKYLCVKHDAVMVSGKTADCMHAIVKYKELKKIYPKLIILDVPRTNIDFINYTAIETIKNGCFFSGKYEGAQVVFNNPHLFIFANQPPQLYTNGKLTVSMDKWKVVKIERETSCQIVQHNTLASPLCSQGSDSAETTCTE